MWLNLALDPGISSMRSLFKRLNIRDINIDLSTFSKASSIRDPRIFYELFDQLKKRLEKEHTSPLDSPNSLVLFPLDSTIITATSKLLWQKDIHQIKLFSGVNLITGSPAGILIHFGQGHDSKYGDETIDATPQDGVAIMDRGFASLSRIKRLQDKKDQYFVVRIKNNMSLNMQPDGRYLIGTGNDQVTERVVWFCDCETKSEFRLVTNLPTTEDKGRDNEEISEFYRLRWQIELLWKFLKMHLQLDRFVTKNVNGIEIQIYASLIAYLILQLMSIPKEFGSKLLDKLRYLSAFMCEEISYVHWFRKLVPRC
jgi:IS4 transposase